MTPKQLKASILQLAIQGKLVPQDPTDEPASELLKRIEALKDENGTKKKKSLPPITDDEKPFPIPDNWVWVRLGDVCLSIADGDHQPPPQQNSGIPFLVISNVSSGKLDFSSTRFVSQEYFKSLSDERIAKQGDFLITVTGSYGIIVPIETDAEFCFQRHMALVKTTQVDNGYLKYALQSSAVKKYFDYIATGCAQKTVSIMSLRNTVIPLPPLAEQKRIVARVEALFKYVDECEDSRKGLAEKLAETLKRSVLQEAIQGKLVPQDPNDEPASELLKRIAAEREKLIAEKKIKKPKPLPPINDDEKPFELPDGWEWTRIGVVCDVFNGNSINEQIKKSKYAEKCDGYSFIATPDVGFDAVINYESGVYIPKGEPKFRIAPKGSVLMCIEGGSAARKFGHLDRDVMFGNKLCCFAPTISDARYIYWYLQSTTFHSIFCSNMTGIIGGVGPETLRSFLIPLPPLAEQKRIVAKLDSLLAVVNSLKLQEAKS